ncbi:unnamed protein product [Notodromas monacha]|uniref:Nuclear cap-binding protein subunit 2 n=1 Tax=Notodromas monacha TaxID=399045 RepID=A0A7R9BH13_9CRUS|nr:unnamed protein product [Notodromas monacha]CAG0913735.1 unnamed protein product [Notodromas monacha]
MRGSDLSAYRDQHFKGSRSEQERLLRLTTTLYVGNLSFYTTEEQIHELFSKAGEVKRIVMGLDRFRKTPCGFCFVEYYTRLDAENCIRYVNGTRLDDRIVRADWDAGFIEGRQYGRGKTGGQVRDEYRTDFDPGRGGFGKIVQQRVTSSHSPTEGGTDEKLDSEPDVAPPSKRMKTSHVEVDEQGDRASDDLAIPIDPPNPLSRA